MTNDIGGIRMAFTTFSFILFLAIVLSVFYLIPKSFRKYWLLLSSYYFYANTGYTMLFTLVAITLLTYIGGFCINKFETNAKVLFGIFFGLNIGALLFFKYTSFCLLFVERIGAYFNLSFDFVVPEIFVPLGLSFIIFQSTTYLGDVYRKKIAPNSFMNCALFVAYFPTLLSGPIQKAVNLLPQFHFDREFETNKFRKGILLIVYGFMVKFFVADALGTVVDSVFDKWWEYQGLYYLLAAVCFSVQIYADFLSYSDIARGVSFLFGIEVTRNFNNPYLSISLAEFWRNWHMSLNEWFVEYIYIPLGGSKKGRLVAARNKMIVFLCSGLWHGASWHYVIWGGLNGVLQIIGGNTKKIRCKLQAGLGFAENSIIIQGLRRVIVFAIITTTWVFFRMPAVSTSVHVIKSMWMIDLVQLFDERIWTIFGTTDMFVALLVACYIFITVQLGRREGMKIYENFCELPKVLQSLLLAICLVVIYIYMCVSLASPDKSFIYFQF